MHRHTALILSLTVGAALTACDRKPVELGQGGSVVSGSAGPAGAHNAAPAGATRTKAR